MIFVTVGTEQYSFDRLMHWIDLLIQNHIIQEEVVVQYGSCTFIPDGVKSYQLLPEESFKEKIKESRMVIAHCGEGTVLLMDSLNKPYILVPRTVTYQEHVDNHQVEMAIALAAVDIPVAWSPGDLVRFIADPVKTTVTDMSEETAKAVCKQLSERFAPQLQAIATP